MKVKNQAMKVLEAKRQSEKEEAHMKFIRILHGSRSQEAFIDEILSGSESNKLQFFYIFRNLKRRLC